MSATNDNEWEYEYDSVETEAFYIPIDLSHIPNTTAQTPHRTGHPTLLKSRLRAAQRVQDTSNLDPPTANGTADAGGEIGREKVGEAQIIGLHTPNPLVMYNGQLLSLTWAESIGTDMFFAEKEDGGDGGEKLRELDGVDLLGVSSAKLVARRGRLRPRDELFGSAGETGVASAQDVDAEEPVRTAIPPTSFLAKLNAAKAKRGDATRLALAGSGDATRLVSGATPRADVEMGGT